PGSGSGCRPLRPVRGAARSRSRCANNAPGIWDSAKALVPNSGFVSSCRQSNITYVGSSRCCASSATDISVVIFINGSTAERGGASCQRLQFRLDARTYEFVEVDHAVFHRRLVWTEFVAALGMQRAPALCHAHADLLVFPRGFRVRLLLGLDEFAF